MKELLIQCHCRSFEFVEFGSFDTEPNLFYITMSAHPRTLGQKLKAIWQVVTGSSYEIGDEIIMDTKTTARLTKFLSQK